MSTLEQLRQRYPGTYISVEALLADHLPHIGSAAHLRRKIREEKIDIQIQQLDPSSRRSPWVIYLRNLAAWLDRQEAAAKAA